MGLQRRDAASARAPPAPAGAARPGSAPLGRPVPARGASRPAARPRPPAARQAAPRRSPVPSCAVANHSDLETSRYGHSRTDNGDSPCAKPGSPRAPSAGRFADVEALADRKRELGLAVSVVLPCREVASTIGPIAAQVGPCTPAPLVDQVVAVDAGSADGTARAGTSPWGSRCIDEEELLPAFGPARGKGDAMWRALSVAGGDLVCSPTPTPPTSAPTSSTACSARFSPTRGSGS